MLSEKIEDSNIRRLFISVLAKQKKNDTAYVYCFLNRNESNTHYALQCSAYALTMPLVYFLTRFSMTLIWGCLVLFHCKLQLLLCEMKCMQWELDELVISPSVLHLHVHHRVQKPTFHCKARDVSPLHDWNWFLQEHSLVCQFPSPLDKHILIEHLFAPMHIESHHS